MDVDVKPTVNLRKLCRYIAKYNDDFYSVDIKKLIDFITVVINNKTLFYTYYLNYFYL